MQRCLMYFVFLLVIINYAAEITHIHVEPGCLAQRFVISSPKPLYALHFPQPPYKTSAHGSLDLFFPHATINDELLAELTTYEHMLYSCELHRIIKPVPGIKLTCKYDKKNCNCSFKPDIANPHKTVIVECVDLRKQQLLNDAHICASHA